MDLGANAYFMEPVAALTAGFTEIESFSFINKNKQTFINNCVILATKTVTPALKKDLKQVNTIFY